jgi:2-keto-4-pentenoate hydratase/2-oxohepta-3-ene-1,7-dioic acid hydratase in catechol pathway
VNVLSFRSRTGVAYGELLPDGSVAELTGDPWVGLARRDVHWSASEIEILPLPTPGKIVGIGLNYREHAAEHSAPIPAEPLIFHIPTSSLIADGSPIQIPHPENRVDEEAELVVVIGKRASRVTVDEAADYVLGCTVGNDVSDRDVQNADRKWTGRSKCFDTFSPLGSVLMLDADWRDLDIRAEINGRVVQHSNTSDMIFDVPTLVSFVSSVCTLDPGDLIYTGTPSGVSPIHPGDEVTVALGDVCVLRNPVELRA